MTQAFRLSASGAPHHCRTLALGSWLMGNPSDQMLLVAVRGFSVLFKGCETHLPAWSKAGTNKEQSNVCSLSTLFCVSLAFHPLVSVWKLS